MTEGTKKDIKEMVIAVFLGFLFWLATGGFHWFVDDPRAAEAMFEEIASHPNVVSIDRQESAHDRKNIYFLRISLKNDAFMEIRDCERDENNAIVYEKVNMVNGWQLWKAVRYADSGKYYCSRASDIEKRLMGNSLEYLLDNYEKLYDLYMNAPEVDRYTYDTCREFFDNISDEGMVDVYDEDTDEVIGVGKLYRSYD